MLTKKAPETIPASLTITGQGETCKFNVTYFNRSQDELRSVAGENKTLSEAVLFVVKEWETEYELTTADLTAMEATRPGVLVAVLEGFHTARRVELEKN